MTKSVQLTIVFWVLMAASVIADPYIEGTADAGAWVIASSLLSAVVVLFWVLADAKESGYRLSAPLKVCVVGLTPLAVPYYIIKNKGFKRAMISFGKFIAYFLGFIVVLVVVESISA